MQGVKSGIQRPPGLPHMGGKIIVAILGESKVIYDRKLQGTLGISCRMELEAEIEDSMGIRDKKMNDLYQSKYQKADSVHGKQIKGSFFRLKQAA